MDMELRRTYLGGTDVAAIAGLAPYKTAWDVWAEKVGLKDPTVPTLRMKVGLALEGILIEEYQDQVGVPVEEWQELIRDPKVEFFGGTPDARWRDDPVGVEIKTAGFRQKYRWGEEGTDDIPEEYLAQVAWYSSLTNFDRWDIAAYIDGEMRLYTYKRDLEFEEALRDAAERFWRDHVLREEPPEPDASKACREWLSNAFPEDRGDIRPATDDEIETLEHLVRAKANLDDAKKAFELYKTKVQALIGDAAGIEWPGGTVTWKKTQGRRSVDWEAIARKLGATDEDIAAATVVKEGSRRFLLKAGS